MSHAPGIMHDLPEPDSCVVQKANLERLVAQKEREQVQVNGQDAQQEDEDDELIPDVSHVQALVCVHLCGSLFFCKNNPCC